MPFKNQKAEKAYHKKYRETHREEFKKYGNKYWHSPKGQETRKEYLKLNPWVSKEHYKIAKKKWHDKNKSRRYKEYKVWALKNKEKIAEKNRIQWLKRKHLGGKPKTEVIRKVYEKNIKKHGSLTCYLCLIKIKFKSDSIDHKVPISKGGTHAISNLGVACISCNIGKKDRSVKHFKRYLRVLRNANLI